MVAFVGTVLAETVAANKGIGNVMIIASGNFDVQLTRMENADAAEVQVAPGSGHTMWIPLPETAVGAFVARYLTAREEAALPT